VEIIAGSSLSTFSDDDDDDDEDEADDDDDVDEWFINMVDRSPTPHGVFEAGIFRLGGPNPILLLLVCVLLLLLLFEEGCAGGF